MKSLRQEIEIHIDTDGIYCGEICLYKNYIWCKLVDEKTGYNFRLEKAKRVKKCLKFFPNK